MEWISVEERLPKDGEHVICWHKMWGIEIALHRSGFGIAIGLLPYDTATHWLPLPQPPIGE